MPLRKRQPLVDERRRTGQRQTAGGSDATTTAPTRSRSSKASRPFGSARPCTSARPGPPGLHHLVYEVVDNSIDEALAGLLQPGQRHDPHRRLGHGGRRWPRHSGRHARERQVGRRSRADGAARRRQVRQHRYKVSGGLHGVGVSVVNALSEGLDLEIWRNGQVYQQRTSAATRRPISTSPARPRSAAPRSRSSPTRRSSRRSSSASTCSRSACANSRS